MSAIEKGFFLYARSLSANVCLLMGTILERSASGLVSGSLPRVMLCVCMISPYFAFLRMSATSRVMMRINTNSTAAVAMSADSCTLPDST